MLEESTAIPVRNSKHIELLKQLIAQDAPIYNKALNTQAEAELQEAEMQHATNQAAELESAVSEPPMAANVTNINHQSLKNQVQNLSPRHRGIMRAVLKGMSNGEIAELTGLSIRTVGMIVHSDVFQYELAKLQELADEKAVESVVDVRAKIKEICGFGVSELEKILKSKLTNPKLKAEIVWDALDREGIAKTERKEVVVDWTTAAINAFKRRKEEQAAQAAMVITPIRIADIPASMEVADAIEAEATELK